MDFQTYRNCWNNADTVPSPIPLNLDIELSSHCNLKCPFCFLSSPNYNINPQFMSSYLALNIINQAKEIGIPALKFNWRGESTLHPDFNKIICYARDIGNFCDLILNTNGNFNISKIPDGLLALTKIIFSVDSLETRIYNNMRRGGQLSIVLKNIEKLLEVRHPNIWIQRTITKENEAEPFALNVRKLLGDKIKISEHLVFDRVYSFSERLKYKRVYCKQPSQRLIVSADGKIYPCCVDYNETMPLGNSTDIMKCWKGWKRKLLIARLKKMPVCFWNKTCKNCMSWCSYEGIGRDFLLLREKNE